MKIEFELLKSDTIWELRAKDDSSLAISSFTSRRKTLLSVARRIELLKPSQHFKVTVEDI